MELLEKADVTKSNLAWAQVMVHVVTKKFLFVAATSFLNLS